MSQECNLKDLNTLGPIICQHNPTNPVLSFHAERCSFDSDIYLHPTVSEVTLEDCDIGRVIIPRDSIAHVDVRWGDYFITVHVIDPSSMHIVEEGIKNGTIETCDPVYTRTVLGEGRSSSGLWFPSPCEYIRLDESEKGHIFVSRKTIRQVIIQLPGHTCYDKSHEIYFVDACITPSESPVLLHLNFLPSF
jgi:hypothetical protein